jgi:hypothetical protein
VGDLSFSSEIGAAEKRAIERLCVETGHASPFDAIVARARVLLAQYGQLTPPFEPEKMAGIQKIIAIDRCDITFDACLLPTPDGFRIEICKYHSRGRQNFSIAHEIGHTFLIELEAELGGARREASLSRHSANSDQVERLCDKAASELIWPTHVFGRDAWNSGPSLDGLLGLASVYKGSVTATARRFADIGPWRCAFVVWETAETAGRPGKIRPKTVYRSSCAALPGPNKLVANEGSQFYRAFDCDYIIKGWETIDATGRRFYTETMKLGQGAISMIIMEPDAEVLAGKRHRRAQPALFR